MDEPVVEPDVTLDDAGNIAADHVILGQVQVTSG